MEERKLGVRSDSGHGIPCHGTLKGSEVVKALPSFLQGCMVRKLYILSSSASDACGPVLCGVRDGPRF